MQFDLRKLCWLWLLIAPVAAHAQLWSGPAALEVRAEDDHGHALAGAHVLAQYTSLNPKDGPPAVQTDSSGRANVAGLAEGAWHVEVSHDGFMTYIAEINVRQKGRPEVVEVTQFRVPNGGTSLMRVKLSRGTPGPPPVRAAVAPQPPPPAPKPAPVVPATPPAPEPKAQPAPEMPKPEAPAPVAPQPTPQPVVPAPQPKPTPEPVVPAPQPTPAPAPPPAAIPAPAPVPPPAAPPADVVRTRTAKDRTCVECQPGETALSTEWVISGAGNGCGDLAAKLKGGTVPADLPGGCHVLRLSLPAGARYTAYRYEVQDGKDSLDCPTAQPCPNNIGRWPGDPVLVRNPQGTVILAPFESGPGGEGRRAVLTVYYTAGRR